MSPPNERGRVSNKPFLPLTVVQHRSASVRYTSDECCLEHSSLDTLRAGEQEPLQLTQLSVHLSSPSLLEFYFQAFLSVHASPPLNPLCYPRRFPSFPAFICSVLSVLRCPGSNVIILTQPTSPVAGMYVCDTTRNGSDVITNIPQPDISV